MESSDPYEILSPNERWVPKQSQMGIFQDDAIDKDLSPFKAVVSVLMLREGWDVRNITTIVGLRPFKADSKILPEQAIGRGLRKMFSLNMPEKFVVVGTSAFLEFVESLKTEGAEFQYSPMGKGSKNKSVKPQIVENQPFLIPKKSLFNKIVGDNAFELEFAAALENRFADVISYAKNTGTRRYQFQNGISSRRWKH